RVAHHLHGRIVELVHIDMRGAESLERPLQREGDVSGIEVHPDAAVIEIPADLRRDVHVLAMAFECLTEDLLAVAPSVYICGVDEIHSELDGPPDGGNGFRVVGRTVRVPVRIAANRPRTEPDFGDLQPCATENSTLHLPRVASCVLRTFADCCCRLGA